MSAAHSSARTDERAGAELHLAFSTRPDVDLAHPVFSDKPLISEIRRLAREVLLCCDRAGLATDKPTLCLQALGITFFGQELVDRAGELGCIAHTNMEAVHA